MAELDLATFAAELRQIVEDAIEQNFEDTSRQKRLGWMDLSPAYKAALARKGRLAGKKILIDRGRLRGSIQVEARREGGTLRVVAGTNVAYAAAHQFGAPRRGIPARPYLALLDEDIEDIRQAALLRLGDELAERIYEGLKRALEGR
jgi:phage gpG-like protein